MAPGPRRRPRGRRLDGSRPTAAPPVPGLGSAPECCTETSAAPNGAEIAYLWGKSAESHTDAARGFCTPLVPATSIAAQTVHRSQSAAIVRLTTLLDAAESARCRRHPAEDAGRAMPWFTFQRNRQCASPTEGQGEKSREVSDLHVQRRSARYHVTAAAKEPRTRQAAIVAALRRRDDRSPGAD